MIHSSWKRCILALWLLAAVSAHAQPYYPVSDEPIELLPSGTTAQMMEDFAGKDVPPPSQPDRTYRNLWVRMFPLITVPLGDPYPETKNLDEFTLYNSQGLQLYGLDDGAALIRGKSIRVDIADGLVHVDGVAYPLEALWIKPQGTVTTTAKWDDGKVRVELRGGFVVKRSMHMPKDLPSRELWSLINVVSVNDYLLSVVPSEVIASWHSETLKAQAIAARTYALYEAATARMKARDFDVDPSTWYQSYQGAQFWNGNAWKTVELASTSRAVQATGNQVILYAGEVIKALFSSNSGGRTCTIRECLEVDYDLPYLREIDDAPGVRSSPGGTWGTRANLTPKAIKDKLAEHGLALSGTVKKLEHLERGISGRTWRLRVIMQDGSAVDLDRLYTRKVMHLFGPIRSFHYELGAMSGGKQAITGWGYGHGVGMSQWGAQLFAKSGKTASQILNHFYYNVRIQEL